MCVNAAVASLAPIRVVQYYIDLDPSTQKNRLMSRKRIMSTDLTPQWNQPRVILDNVRSIELVGLGLDGNTPDGTTVSGDINWRVTQSIDQNTEAGKITQALNPNTQIWPRVARVDLRLSMQSKPSNSNAAKPVIRNFESSYTVRARVSLDTL